MNELELLLLKMHKEGRIPVTGTYFVLMPDETIIEFAYAYSSINDEVTTVQIPQAGDDVEDAIMKVSEVIFGKGE
jgi:hypothetical protein